MNPKWAAVHILFIEAGTVIQGSKLSFIILIILIEYFITSFHKIVCCMRRLLQRCNCLKSYNPRRVSVILISGDWVPVFSCFLLEVC